MRPLAIAVLLWLLSLPVFAQSGPELDALMEVITAKDVATMLRHVPPDLQKAVAELPPASQREIAEEFLISTRLEREGVKATRPESGPVLVIEREVGDEMEEEAEIYLDRRFSDGDETLLRFRIESKSMGESERDMRVSIGLRYVDDEWRIYEVEGGKFIHLDDTKLLDRFIVSRQLGNEAMAIGALRIYNTAMITYSSTFPDVGFPSSLTVLGGEGGSPDHAGLVDNLLSSPPFEKSGYRFTYYRRCNEEYTIVARPSRSGSDSDRSFFTDQSGVIRYTKEDRDPTADDDPLQ